MHVEMDYEQDSITVDGVEISLSVLAVLSNPDEKLFYRFEKHGGVVYAEGWTRRQIVRPWHGEQPTADGG